MLGNEFRINSYTHSTQYVYSIGVFKNNNFVVVWYSNQDGSSYGIYAQLYNYNL